MTGLVFLALLLAPSLLAAQQEQAPGFDGESVEAPHPLAVEVARAGSKPVSFRDDVLPILRQHCFACHSRKMPAGGLRLDSRAHAERGGDSRLPVLSTDPEQSVLYQRIATDDAAARMPKSSPPLSDLEIEVIRLWLAQGADWPGDQSGLTLAPQPTPAPWLMWLNRFLDIFQILQYQIPFLPGWILLLLAPQILILAVERGRRAYWRGEPWKKSQPSRWISYCGRVSRLRYIYWLGISLLLTSVGAMTAHGFTLYNRIAELKEQVQSQSARLQPVSQGSVFDGLFGAPPVPHRPHHPRRLFGTYYRGNCERNEKLFNNGNYTTARFHIDLCDASGRRLVVGDAVPRDGLFVRFELERAPNTTETLFSRPILNSIFLSESVLGGSFDKPVDRMLDKPLAKLDEVQADWRWTARIPVLAAGKSIPEKLSGLVYVYKGDPDSSPPHGEWHYAIKYDLTIADGHLTAESDLWMGVLYFSGNLAWTEIDKIPLCEWFDWRPLPDIVGPNSTDPALLGIPEHVPPQKTQHPSGNR